MSEATPVMFPNYFRPFRPMLAYKRPKTMSFEDFLSALRFPTYETPKIDGVRAIMVDQPGDRADWCCMPLSRHLKPIPNRHVREWLGTNLPPGPDGELVVIDSSGNLLPYYECSSELLSYEGRPNWRYYIFDYITPASRQLPYLERMAMLDDVIINMGIQVTEDSPIRVLTPTKVSSREEMANLLDQRIREGYEGSCVRMNSYGYKFGRGTLRNQDLVAIKLYEDSDAVVLGCEPLNQNFNEAETSNLGYTVRARRKGGMRTVDLLGALRVKDLVTKVEFNVGSGFTEQQREQLWLERDSLRGRVIKYQHQPHGAKGGGRPRIPSFIGFREDGMQEETP